MNTETTVTPPLTDHDDGDGDTPYVAIRVSLLEDDGTHREAATNVCAEDDDTVAAALVDCLRGITAARGPGLQLALAKRVTIH